MSAESHDEGVRRRFGKNYDNASLETTIKDAFELGCLRFDLFFMIGLPEQTAESVRGTIDYCDRLLASLGPEHVKKLHPFISPLAPFLDFFVIGDGEDAVLELAETLRPLRKAPRREKLEALAQLEGFYVPALYPFEELDDGQVLPKEDAPKIVKSSVEAYSFQGPSS